MNGEKVKKLSHLTNMSRLYITDSHYEKTLGQNFNHENNLTKYG
jgi:hypothetical protein